MNNDAIKSANCKALPKFILLTLISTAMKAATATINGTGRLNAPNPPEYTQPRRRLPCL